MSRKELFSIRSWQLYDLVNCSLKLNRGQANDVIYNVKRARKKISKVSLKRMKIINANWPLNWETLQFVLHPFQYLFSSLRYIKTHIRITKETSFKLHLLYLKYRIFKHQISHQILNKTIKIDLEKIQNRRWFDLINLRFDKRLLSLACTPRNIIAINHYRPTLLFCIQKVRARKGCVFSMSQF